MDALITVDQFGVPSMGKDTAQFVGRNTVRGEPATVERFEVISNVAYITAARCPYSNSCYTEDL